MKKYCCRCRFHIPFLAELSKEREGENGFNICSASMKIETNCIGEQTFSKSGEKQFCQSCGTILYDERRVIYKKCVQRNESLKCPDFKPKGIWRVIAIVNKVRNPI